MLLAGCKDKKNMDNPFFSEWNTPYEIPDFSRIKTEHYMPAFKEAMKQQKEWIDNIANFWKHHHPLRVQRRDAADCECGLLQPQRV